MRMPGSPRLLCLTSIALTALVACNILQGPLTDGDGQDEGLNQLGGITEGDTGFFHRGATECFGVAARPIEGTDVWIGPSGSDDNSGATEDEPFGTMPHALCNLEPGQTLHILPGTYSASVMLAGFGDAASSIRIRGETSSDGRPVFDGGGTLTMGIAIIESSNFIVEGLEFRNYTDEGLFVALTDDVEVRDCVFADNGFDSIEPDANGEGFGIAVTNTATQTLIQTAVEGHMRGRVMSLVVVIYRGLPAFGALILGRIAEDLGLQISLAGGAVACLLAWVWATVHRRRIIPELEGSRPPVV